MRSGSFVFLFNWPTLLIQSSDHWQNNGQNVHFTVTIPIRKTLPAEFSTKICKLWSIKLEVSHSSNFFGMFSISSEQETLRSISGFTEPLFFSNHQGRRWKKPLLIGKVILLFSPVWIRKFGKRKVWRKKFQQRKTPWWNCKNAETWPVFAAVTIGRKG